MRSLLVAALVLLAAPDFEGLGGGIKQTGLGSSIKQAISTGKPAPPSEANIVHRFSADDDLATASLMSDSGSDDSDMTPGTGTGHELLAGGGPDGVGAAWTFDASRDYTGTSGTSIADTWTWLLIYRDDAVAAADNVADCATPYLQTLSVANSARFSGVGGSAVACTAGTWCVAVMHGNGASDQLHINEVSGTAGAYATSVCGAGMAVGSRGSAPDFNGRLAQYIVWNVIVPQQDIFDWAKNYYPTGLSY